MRISLNWLRELVEFDMDPEVLAEALTMAGFEVEEIEDRRTWANGVVLGKVTSCEPHPNADRLRVCQVDTGAESTLNIVCGAANVQKDLYVPVATVGTYLAKVDLKVRPSKLRGVSSEGMICSLAELGLEKESSGIHRFELKNPQIGSDVRPLLGLDDVILDLTSTANRADALSMVGIAREVAAITGAPLKLPSPPAIQVPSADRGVAIKISETHACPAYIGTVIEQVKVGPSAEWLQRRLQSAGTRPINNVVDVTNYILLEWGQPLHAFDRDSLHKVAGSDSLTLGVRFAEPEETLVTLDSQKRALHDQTLVITANNQPVALAGLMGGEATEVHAESQNLILEAALFNSTSIRRSARSQGLRTEASARYERGVNDTELEVACAHALQMIQDLAGGVSVSQQLSDRRVDSKRSIELRLSRVNQVLGPVESEAEELLPDEVKRLLEVLGFTVAATADNQAWTVNVPPYRYRDIEREIDLIEEIARLYGYNNFCDTLPAKTEVGQLSLDQSLIRRLREAFRATGLTELMHYTLVKPGIARQVTIINPLFSEYSALRTDLLAGLIDACQYNWEQGNGCLNGFEIGRVFWQNEDCHNEADAIAGILGGNLAQGKWLQGDSMPPMTWFEAKGVLESVFERLGLPVEYQPDRRDSRLHPGRTASLWIQGVRLGSFGQLHPQLRRERDLPDEVYAFELDLDVLLDYLAQSGETEAIFRPYSTYPASDRDIAFFAPVQITVAELERVICQAAGPLLESVELFDEYRGENVPAGQRSLAFRLVYRERDRTLTDAEVEPIHRKVRQVLEEKLCVSLRS